MTTKYLKDLVTRRASQDLEEYPKWDLTRPLPKLPVPSLDRTLQTYLGCIKPVISEEEYRRYEEIVANFAKPGADGERLQRKLQEFAGKTENWAYNWWLNDMYMKNKAPLPVWSNPGMVFPRQIFRNEEEQLRFAARLVAGILDYKVIIDSRGLPVDRCSHRERGQPMCMEQYYRLFTSYRIPGIQSDSLQTITDQSREPDYIIIIHRGQIFSLIVGANKLRLSEDDIFCQLRRISRLSKDGKQSPVGVLTSLSRNIWAEARNIMMEDDKNRENLEKIARSIFVLCLDEAVTENINKDLSEIDNENGDARDDASLGFQMLHGSSSKANSCNRWYDKTMQFIISRDGNCGLNYEHSPAEGIAVIRLTEHILNYIDELKHKRLCRVPSLAELAYPKPIQWNIDPRLVPYIDRAISDIDKLAEDLDMRVLRYIRFGRDFPKMVNMSPDSFIQLALQLAHYKLHKRLVHTYESASTRRFRLGRVDNIRSASVAALDWVKAMVDDSVSNETRIGLLRAAMKWQTDYMIQTILGNGLDCHLLGLKQIAEETENQIPELFSDYIFAESNQFLLSTSQVPTTMDAFMCYGAVVQNGYGVSYNPHPSYIVFCISSFKSSPETGSEKFEKSLIDALNEMEDLCLKTGQVKMDGSLITRFSGMKRSALESARKSIPEVTSAVSDMKIVAEKFESHSEANENDENSNLITTGYSKETF